MADIPRMLADVDAAKKAVRAVDGTQVQSRTLTDMLHTLAETYFKELRGSLPADGDTDAAFSRLHELSRKKPSKQKCIEALTEARSSLVGMESRVLTQVNTRTSGSLTPVDERIIATLKEIRAPAAAAYAQGIKDLEALDRASWRGPATELREALRETLDALAPDADVDAMPGYKPEASTQRPTMKQKVKFIFRSRGMNSGQIAHSEAVVQSVEDMIGGITRSVYTRSSVSTHTPTNRDEVLRLHAWVRLILCELLALPVQ
jgi:Predicted pPIWI-associating nuclease